MKRKIKPHKGGRTKQVQARITPESKRRLDDLLKARELSLADWIVEMLARDEREQQRN